MPPDHVLDLFNGFSNSHWKAPHAAQLAKAKRGWHSPLPFGNVISIQTHTPKSKHNTRHWNVFCFLFFFFHARKSILQKWKPKWPELKATWGVSF